MAAVRNRRPASDRTAAEDVALAAESTGRTTTPQQQDESLTWPPPPALTGIPADDAGPLAAWAGRTRTLAADRERDAINAVLAESVPPGVVPDWQGRMEQMSPADLEQVAVTEARAVSAAAADSFTAGLRVGHQCGYYAGLADGAAWLASRYMHGNDEALSAHHKALGRDLAACVNETFVDRMERLGDHDRAQRARQIARRWAA